MTDNVTLPATGQVIRTVEIGGVDYTAVILFDALGNEVPTTLMANGRGLNVVMLNDAGVKGLVNEGADFPDNPVFIGGRATTSLIAQTPLATGKVTAARFTADGRLLTAPWCNPEDQLPTNPITLTTTSNVVCYAAQITPVRNALIGLAIVNSSATETAVIIKDGTTEVGRIWAPTAGKASAVSEFPLPIRGTAATILHLALSVAATSVIVTPFGFKTKV